MKKIMVVLVAATFAMSLLQAQYQLENPGFELWDDILIGASDTIREPAEWSSLKTTDDATMNSLAPVVCKRSTDAHNGSYSVKLTNVLTLLVANGTVTNGRVHANLNTSLAYMYTDTLDSHWNTPFTARPDSIAGWFKYTPQTGDTLEVKVILHRGYGKQPDNDYLNNWIALAHFRSALNTGSQWIRFSTPFNYYNDKNPQYMLVILNSGNGFYPVAGSIAWFDDLEMIYNSPQNTLDNSITSSEIIYALGNQYIVIQGTQPGKFSTIRMMDITGRVVWNGHVTTDHVDIAQANLKKGIYLVSLSGKNALRTQKIVVH